MKIELYQKYFIVLILTSFVFLTINSCKKSSPTEPKNTNPSTSSGGSALLGSITYTPDYSRKKSAALDTNAIDISTTDASGIKWDLNIPKQDVADSITISIIPIKDVKSDSIYNITNGVVFQPDGFQFSSPAILTVTVPSNSKKYAFYQFTQSGKGVEFASFSGNGGVYKILISHFSGTAAGVPSSMDQICKQGLDIYNEAVNEENKIISQDPEVPVPPDLEIDCTKNASNEQSLDKYIKNFMLPEDSVLKKMLGGISAMQLAGCNGSITAGGLAQATPLAEHLVQKAQMAYNQYSNDNKKYLAIVRAMLSADAQLQLLGGTPPANDLAQLGAWTKNYFNDQLNKLKQNHDYTVIKSLMPLAAQAQLFGANDQSSYNDILNALTFKLELNEELNQIYSDGTQGDHIFINGVVKIIPALDNPAYFIGTGSINYTSGYTFDDCEDANGDPQHTHDELVTPQSFPLTITMDSLDLCDQNFVVLKFDSLGSSDEQWNYGVGLAGAHNCYNGNSNMSREVALTDNFIAFANSKYYNFDSDGFIFHPMVQNGNAIVFDKTYTETFNYQYSSGYTLKAKLELKLVHTPQ